MLDEWENSIGTSSAHIHCLSIPVLKETPKGVWIGYHWDDRRFVLRDARKRYACPTKLEALESFRQRKRRQYEIYRARIKHIEELTGLIRREQDVLQREVLV